MKPSCSNSSSEIVSSSSQSSSSMQDSSSQVTSQTPTQSKVGCGGSISGLNATWLLLVVASFMILKLKKGKRN